MVAAVFFSSLYGVIMDVGKVHLIGVCVEAGEGGSGKWFAPLTVADAVTGGVAVRELEGAVSTAGTGPVVLLSILKAVCSC